MRTIITMFFFLMNLLLLSVSVWAYGGDVHFKIIEESTNFSNLNSALKNQLGFANGAESVVTNVRQTRSAWQCHVSWGRPLYIHIC